MILFSLFSFQLGGNRLMSYTLDFSLALGSAKAGLTLNAQLVDTAGANVGSAISTGFVDMGNGNYLWHYAAFPDGHRGGVKFYEQGVPSTILAFAAINPEEAENVDKKVSIGPLDTYLTGHTAAGTMGRALQLARSQARGKWILNAAADTLTLYDLDGTSVVAIFNLTPAGGPYTTRTPTTAE